MYLFLANVDSAVISERDDGKRTCFSSLELNQGRRYEFDKN